MVEITDVAVMIIDVALDSTKEAAAPLGLNTWLGVMISKRNSNLYMVWLLKQRGCGSVKPDLGSLVVVCQNLVHVQPIITRTLFLGGFGKFPAQDIGRGCVVAMATAAPFLINNFVQPK